jgi:hypothetical protein
MNIQPVEIQFLGTATQLIVRVLSFDTSATTCSLYYELQDENGVQLIAKNYTLTTGEFTTWTSDNIYLEDLICNMLGLTKV